MSPVVQLWHCGIMQEVLWHCGWHWVVAGCWDDSCAPHLPSACFPPGPPKQWGQLGVKKGCFSCDVASYRVPCLPASGLTCLHRVCTNLPRHMLPFLCHQGEKSCTTPFLLSPEKNLHFHQKVFTAPSSLLLLYLLHTSNHHPNAKVKRESRWVMLNWSIPRCWEVECLAGAQARPSNKPRSLDLLLLCSTRSTNKQKHIKIKA